MPVIKQKFICCFIATAYNRIKRQQKMDTVRYSLHPIALLQRFFFCFFDQISRQYIVKVKNKMSNLTRIQPEFLIAQYTSPPSTQYVTKQRRETMRDEKTKTKRDKKLKRENNDVNTSIRLCKNDRIQMLRFDMV